MKNVIGKTGDDVCPVRTLLTYVPECRGSQSDLLNQWSSLCKSEKVRLSLEMAKLPVKVFGRHSFRIEAANNSALAGLPDSAI